MTKESLDEKSEQKKQEKTEQFQIKKEKEGEEEQFALFVILRTELDNSQKISKMLYLLQDELELENTLSGHSCLGICLWKWGSTGKEVPTIS